MGPRSIYKLYSHRTPGSAHVTLTGPQVEETTAPRASHQLASLSLSLGLGGLLASRWGFLIGSAFGISINYTGLCASRLGRLLGLCWLRLSLSLPNSPRLRQGFWLWLLLSRLSLRFQLSCRTTRSSSATATTATTPST